MVKGYLPSTSHLRLLRQTRALDEERELDEKKTWLQKCSIIMWCFCNYTYCMPQHPILYWFSFSFARELYSLGSSGLMQPLKERVYMFCVLRQFLVIGFLPTSCISFNIEKLYISTTKNPWEKTQHTYVDQLIGCTSRVILLFRKCKIKIGIAFTKI